MSTGFPVDASAGKNVRSASMVEAPSGGSTKLVRLACVGAKDAKPSAFVTRTARLPGGGGCVASSIPTSNISESVSVRMTPLSRNNASTVKVRCGDESSRVRPRGSLAGLRPPALHRDDRCALPDPAGEA